MMNSVALTSLSKAYILIKRKKFSSRQMHHMLYLNCKYILLCLLPTLQRKVKVGRKKKKQKQTPKTFLVF